MDWGRQRGFASRSSRCPTSALRGRLQLNVHFHTLPLDGVFAAGEDGSLEFHAAEPPSDEEVARLLAPIYLRLCRPAPLPRCPISSPTPRPDTPPRAAPAGVFPDPHDDCPPGSPPPHPRPEFS